MGAGTNTRAGMAMRATRERRNGDEHRGRGVMMNQGFRTLARTKRVGIRMRRNTRTSMTDYGE